MNWEKKRYYSLSDYYKEIYHKKTFKVALDGGFTCPNRDGTKGTSGCIFCSSEGSGDFAQNRNLTITEQINHGIQTIKEKTEKDCAFIGYFQSFTNTYGSVSHCQSLFEEALSHPDICGLSIATRPDCLSSNMIEMISKLNQSYPITVELGLQTIHQHTAAFIKRGYSLDIFEHAVSALNKAGIRITVHLILGLPEETRKEMLASVSYVNQLPIQGIKLAMLHILKGTPLGMSYENAPWPLLSLDEYTDLIVTCIGISRSSICMERLTGDGPKNLLLAPLWTENKRMVLNTIAAKCKRQSITQGCLRNL